MPTVFSLTLYTQGLAAQGRRMRVDVFSPPFPAISKIGIFSGSRRTITCRGLDFDAFHRDRNKELKFGFRNADMPMMIQIKQRGSWIDVIEWNVNTQEIIGDGDVPPLTPSLACLLSDLVHDPMTGMILWVTRCRESGSNNLIDSLQLKGRLAVRTFLRCD